MGWNRTTCIQGIEKSFAVGTFITSTRLSRDFILYLAASESTIGVVLVQEDDKLVEHVVYYLRYSHIEKLALVVVYVVQRLRHYILLRTTTVVADVNPFQYVLSWRIVGGKFNKWIVILQDFDLDFQSAKSKKSLVFAELIE